MATQIRHTEHQCRTFGLEYMYYQGSNDALNLVTFFLTGFLIDLRKRIIKHSFLYIPTHPFLLSFFLRSWRAVRSYRPHLEERDSVGDDGSSAPSSVGLLSEVSGIFLSRKANARRCAHSPRYNFIITLIIIRQTWLTRHLGQVTFG